MRPPRRILGISLLALLLPAFLPALLRPADARLSFAPAPAQAQQAPYRLDIVGGSGSGQYAAVAELPIEVWRMPDSRVFRRWETSRSLQVDPGFDDIAVR